MAKKVTVILTDDIDGAEANETLSFALEGVAYTIDLSTKNAEKLRKAMAPFIAAGTRDRAAAALKSGRGRKAAGNGPAATQIREWAASQGMQVSARGRVPAEVREAYENAHA